MADPINDDKPRNGMRDVEERELYLGLLGLMQKASKVPVRVQPTASEELADGIEFFGLSIDRLERALDDAARRDEAIRRVWRDMDAAPATTAGAVASVSRTQDDAGETIADTRAAALRLLGGFKAHVGALITGWSVNGLAESSGLAGVSLAGARASPARTARQEPGSEAASVSPPSARRAQGIKGAKWHAPQGWLRLEWAEGSDTDLLSASRAVDVYLEHAMERSRLPAKLIGINVVTIDLTPDHRAALEDAEVEVAWVFDEQHGSQRIVVVFRVSAR